ncbi:sugar-binding domain-containing protein [Tundrisphaera lichenicola]|uniref:glycoside hydrolase family 2 protein n=1 Tax=Tundrisphaera lichenicola TaxID=2029860 RepID=UPI003EBBFBC8
MHLRLRLRTLIPLLLTFASWPASGADWKAADGPLMTRWAKEVGPDNALPEYPRPQMVRTDWKNLNGLWQLSFGKEGDSPPIGKDLDQQILVPFPVESALSGVMKHSDRLWYRRTFEVPKEWEGRRVLLHFGAVDWEATVFVNGQELGTHKGGYDGFRFDITDALKPDAANEVIVRVFDPTDAGTQPRGKQVLKPGGIYYTPTTGIWQTVWIEPVAPTHIESLKLSTDLALNTVSVAPFGLNDRDDRNAPIERTVTATVFDGERELVQTTGLGESMPLKIPEPKLWTPETPFLYGLKVEVKEGGKVVDAVGSYFGMRSIEVSPDEKEVNRIKLNGKPIFQVGPLDQGFWPDGLYTAPTDEALRYDIEITKKFGYNMTRKHVKVEPARWYYWCDKLGLLVWQDMPSGDRSINPDQPDIVRTPESAHQYEVELKAMIDGLRNHPSIITWVTFNEGWGQFDTKRIAEWAESYDPTRLVDAVSGWADRAGVGDMHDLHNYPRPAAPPLEPRRAGVLGEFGGLALGVDGHTWQKEIWGYQGTASADELTRKYERLLREGWDMKDAQGLNALVYTQITDVETEANGLLTYDRAIIKLDIERAAAVNRGDVSKIPVPYTVVPTSRENGLAWRYSTEKPSANWAATDFDDASWKQGPGVLGTEGTPGARVRTTWNTPDVYARRTFDLPEINPAYLLLNVLHDEDAEIYLNGVLAASVKGYTSSYDEIPISPEARATLKPGKNLFAVHCHQTAGGQSIDVGLIELKAAAR